MPEISNVFRRCGIDFHQVTGMLDQKDVAWEEIGDWLMASKVAHCAIGIGRKYKQLAKVASLLGIACVRIC